nr:MAG TPA: kalata B8 backbone, cystine knot, beta-hairpin [Caudoviricetes sp.]
MVVFLIPKTNSQCYISSYLIIYCKYNGICYKNDLDMLFI